LGGQGGNPPGVNFNGCGICDGKHHDVGLDAGFFGTPSIATGYVNMDIDWTALLGYVQSQRIWGAVDISKATEVREIFESAGYGTSAGSGVGGVDTFQSDWTMYYPGLQTR
jgi:hypothetical protein